MYLGTKLRLVSSINGLIARIIGLFKKTRGQIKPGDMIKVSVRKVEPNGKLKKGDVSNAVVTCSRQKRSNRFGIFVKSLRNIAVLTNPEKILIKASEKKGTAAKLYVGEAKAIKVLKKANGPINVKFPY